MKATLQHPRSPAFLLAQVGAHAAGRFAERLGALGLVPAHAGMLRLIDARSGINQQALSSMLGLPPSRLVALVDDLEERGLVERRSSSDDRRVYALHLTQKGREMLAHIADLSRQHDNAICTALTLAERDMLGGFLRRIADQQGLTPGVHPGLARLGRQPSKDHKDDESSRDQKRRRP